MRGAKAVAWEKVWRDWPMERGIRPPKRGNPEVLSSKVAFGHLRLELERLRERAEAAEAALKVSADVRAEARGLYDLGVSNWWISRLLKIPVSEARRLTA